MARLPIIGEDNGIWGTVLNTFLEVSHNVDGSLRPSAVSSAGGYTRPASGIPSGDMANEVQAALASAATALQPVSTVGGDLSGTISSPIVVRLNGINIPRDIPTTGQVLTATNGNTLAWETLGSSINLDSVTDDIRPLGMQDAGSSTMAAKADHVHAMPTLDQVNVPEASIDFNFQQINNLASGVAASDAATIGQIPTSLPPSGNAEGDLGGTYPNPIVSGVKGVAIANSPSASNQVLTTTSTSSAQWSTPISGPTQVLSATANGTIDTNAYCSPGSHNIASTAGLYTQAMVGHTAVFIQGGSGGASDIVTSVQSVIDSNHIVLAATVPGATGNPQTIIIGTDISSTLSTAFANAGSSNLPLYIPAGIYIKTNTITIPSNVTIIGAGRQETVIIHASSTTDAFKGTDTTSIVLEDWTVLGPGVGVGTGSGVNLTLSANPATYYPTLRRFSASQFGLDGIAISTPIVGQFEQVVPEHNGRYGLNLSGAGEADGTSCALSACFSAGNWGAGYHFKQMAYSSLTGCAADANGVAYLYDTCIGITEAGCGSEETYNFNLNGFTTLTPNGLSRYIFNSKVVMSSPYMINNVGTSCWVTGGSKVVINDYYEGSPGNSDDSHSNPAVSLQVDSGSIAVVNGHTTSTAMSLAIGTTTLVPDILAPAYTVSQQITLSSDQSLVANSSDTLLSLTLSVGKWLLSGVVTVQQGAAAGNTDIRFIAGTAVMTGGTATTIRAASANQPSSSTLTAIINITTAGTVLLNAYPVAATTVKAATTANAIPGATSFQAAPLFN